jgi:dolichol-phosphate mannosyltransferase/undecaprenyl-phosphate 4-deoxy-4-formamido-L-arabinose transferase
MLISIVIPVYKSTSTLAEIAQRSRHVFDQMEGYDYEIVFVNDSPFWPATCEALASLVKQDPRVTAIELTKNFGQQPATLCGIEHAHGDYMVTMDDDLQHAPEDIPLLLAKADHDAVIARFRVKHHSLFKRVTSKLKGHFDTIILGKPPLITLSPFRLLKAPIARFMLKRNTPYPFIPALLFEVTDDVVNVDAEHHPRADGSGHYSLVRMIRLFSNLLVSNSSLLLRLVGYVGFGVALVAFLYAVVILFRAAFHDVPVAGWPSTFTAILFFGGMILLTLGIVGEYLVRIIATTEQRPTYFVRQVIGNGQDGPNGGC